jgi:uncharacterized protein
LTVLWLPILVMVQWWISGELSMAAFRRFRGPLAWMAAFGAWAYGAAALICYLLSFSDYMSRFGIAGPYTTMLGAAGLTYAVLAPVCVVLYVGVRAARKHMNAGVDPGRRRIINMAGNLAIAAPVALVGHGALIQRTKFGVRELEVAIAGLPDDLDGLRLLHVSDIHLSPFLSVSELERVIDACRELNPNIALVTGDLISTKGDPLDACIRQIARLKSDAGIYGCMGNHERYAQAEAYTERAASQAGVLFLRGGSQSLRFGNATVNVAGVDYQALAGRRTYLKTVAGLSRPGAFNLLLSHNPDVFPVAVKQGWNLTLAGHTHGGQVSIEILDTSLNPARFLTPYVYGLYRLGASAEYVTRGIGTIGIPVRIGAPPEVALLRLRKA